jgi:hypothetical protein
MNTIQQGYVAFTGHVFTQAEAESYNRHCADTEKALRSGSPEVIAFRQDQQCRMFKAIIGAH